VTTTQSRELYVLSDTDKTILNGIAKEVGEMFDRLKVPVSDTPAGLIDDLRIRSIFLARASEMQGIVQMFVDYARGFYTEKYLNYSATVMKELVSSSVAQFSRLMNQVERLNSTCVHQIDSIRSILSYEKSNMQNLGGGIGG